MASAPGHLLTGSSSSFLSSKCWFFQLPSFYVAQISTFLGEPAYKTDVYDLGTGPIQSFVTRMVGSYPKYGILCIIYEEKSLSM